MHPGVSELQQLVVSLNLSSSYTHNIRENFDTIRSQITYIISIKISDSCVQILAKEKRQFGKKSTRSRFGGSGFHTIAEGKSTIAYCPYVDHANDSYTIFCPLHDNCVTVVSHLLYFDYLPYAANVDRYATNKIVFRKRLCGTSKFIFPQNSLHWSRKTGYSSDLQSVSNAFPWQLQLNNSDLISHNQLLQCRQFLNVSIYFLGDSHCLFLARHAFSILNNDKTQTVLYTDSNIGRIHYFRAAYAVEKLIPALRNLLTSLRTKNLQATVIFDVGSWDMQYRNISHFATDVIPAIQNAMIDMQRIGLFDKTKVIFFDMPPVPLWDRDGTSKRNLMALAAGNRLLADAMRNLNIKYVGYFALARIFVNHSSPNDAHYLTVKNNISTGDVGIEIANYILQLICEDLT